MYFSRVFSLKTTVQISSQSVKISSGYAASQFEKYGFEKNAFKVLSDIIFYLETEICFLSLFSYFI